jgi:hypothetical protein
MKKGIGREMAGHLACDSDFHVNRRALLHAANLQHRTDGFNSPPKEAMLWIFSPEKSDGFGRVRTRDLGYQGTPLTAGVTTVSLFDPNTVRLCE